MNDKKKLKIAWFSDLSKSGTEDETLSSYFSRLILPHLREKFDLTLYHNSFAAYQDYKTFHYLKAFENDRQEQYDLFFYQLEDDKRADFTRSHLGLIPGITYFHHFNFTNYGPEPLLNSPYQDIVAKFNSGSEAWPKRDKKHKPLGPAAYREAALSPVAVFSNPHSLNEYKRQVSVKLSIQESANGNAFYLPYPVKQDEGLGRASTANFSAAYIGSTRLESRAHKVLAAVKENDIKLNWLLPRGERAMAEELFEEFGINGAEIYEGLSTDTWQKMVLKSSCVIHTLFSAYGHIEPYLGISLSAGLPCLVTNFAGPEGLPENIVFKIQPGDSESLQISEVLKSLAEKRAAVDADLLKNYCRELYQPEQIAGELAHIFHKRISYISLVRKKWDQLAGEARRSLLKESESFIDGDNGNFKTMLEPAFEELGWKV